MGRYNGAERCTILSFQHREETQQTPRPGTCRRTGESVRTRGNFRHGAGENEGNSRGLPQAKRHPSCNYSPGVF